MRLSLSPQTERSAPLVGMHALSEGLSPNTLCSCFKLFWAPLKSISHKTVQYFPNAPCPVQIACFRCSLASKSATNCGTGSPPRQVSVQVQFNCCKFFFFQQNTRGELAVGLLATLCSPSFGFQGSYARFSVTYGAFGKYWTAQIFRQNLKVQILSTNGV